MNLEEFMIKYIECTKEGVYIQYNNGYRVSVDLLGMIFSLKYSNIPDCIWSDKELFGKTIDLFIEKNNKCQFDSTDESHIRNYHYVKCLYKRFFGL